MTDDPLDLTALDPDQDDRAADRFVADVMGRIAANPDPYPVPVGLFWGLSSMAAPIALAATVILALAAALMTRTASTALPAPQTVAQSIGVPNLFPSALAEERR